MFPTIVYRTPGAHQRAGGTYSYQGIADAETLESALADGWFRTLPEAIDGKHDDATGHEDEEMPTREELEAKAKELEIKFDGRTTDKSLAEKIEHVLGEQE